MLLPLFPLLSLLEWFKWVKKMSDLHIFFHLVFWDVCFNCVLPIIFSFNIFKEGSLEKIPLVYVRLGCVCLLISQQKSVGLSTSLLPLFNIKLMTNSTSMTWFNLILLNIKKKTRQHRNSGSSKKKKKTKLKTFLQFYNKGLLNSCCHFTHKIEFTHLHVVPHLYIFLPFVENERRYWTLGTSIGR